jgi:hypothetical protein
LAISSAAAIRPSGILATRGFSTSASDWPVFAIASRMFLSWRSVRTAVGTMALTRMPSLPSSLAKATVKFCTAALLTPVAMAPSCGVQAAPPDTLMMRPHLRSRIGGTAWRMQRTVPRSLLSKAWSQFSSVIAKKLPGVTLVALLTRMSRRPNSASIFLNRLSTAAGSLRSVGTPITRPFDWPFSLSVACAFRAGSRLATTTWAPSFSNSAEMA